VGGWIVNVVVTLMFIAGLLVPTMLIWDIGPWVPRRILVAMLWVGCAVLLLRGGLGLLDGLVRYVGLFEGGLTGLSYEQTLGVAQPSTYTLWSGALIDAYFAIGGLAFGWSARRERVPLGGSTRA
jgi:hypothetical protein